MERYILIAGVNGAGKTTFYSTEEKFGDLIKINFDETVRSIGDWKNAADIKKAGLLVWKKIEECFERNLSFSQETTLCGQSILKNIRRAKESGYYIELYFVGVDSPETAKARVKQRMSKGGHGISDEDIERRYSESLCNLKRVLPLCDLVTIFDNSIKLTKVSIFRQGECEWSAENRPDWYRDLNLE